MITSFLGSVYNGMMSFLGFNTQKPYRKIENGLDLKKQFEEGIPLLKEWMGKQEENVNKSETILKNR